LKRKRTAPDFGAVLFYEDEPGTGRFSAAK
jgi:hypothetical protein